MSEWTLTIGDAEVPRFLYGTAWKESTSSTPQLDVACTSRGSCRRLSARRAARAARMRESPAGVLPRNAWRRERADLVVRPDRTPTIIAAFRLRSCYLPPLMTHGRIDAIPQLAT